MMFRLLLLVASISLTGCATLVAPFSNQPMDLHHGERTWGAAIEDQAIETKVRVNIKRAGPPLVDQRIIVVSYNGNLLLAGQVANEELDRKSTRLNSSHVKISYAVFCLKKKKKKK